MNTQHKQDLIDRLTYCIECYGRDFLNPLDTWFCTESEKEAILEAYEYFGHSKKYQKIEVREYESDKRIAILYR